jgi:hypothetical protein
MPLDNASSRVGVMCLLIGIRYLCTYKGGCLLDLRIHITSMSTNVQFMVCFVLYPGLHLPRDDCHFGYKQKFLKKTFFGSFFVSLENFLIVGTTKLETFFSIQFLKNC